MIRCINIMEVIGQGFVITFREGHQKMVLTKDVFELKYEYDNDGNDWIVLRTKFGDYQAHFMG